MFEPFTGDKGPEHDGLGLYLAGAAVSGWGGRVLWLPDPPARFAICLPRSTP